MDKTQTEDAMYRPIQVLHKMLRTANKWANDPDESSLGRILEQALMSTNLDTHRTALKNKARVDLKSLQTYGSA